MSRTFGGMNGALRRHDARYDPYFIQTTFEIMQSQVVLSNVIDALNLNASGARNISTARRSRPSETMEILKQRMQLAPGAQHQADCHHRLQRRQKGGGRSGQRHCRRPIKITGWNARNQLTTNGHRALGGQVQAGRTDKSRPMPRPTWTSCARIWTSLTIDRQPTAPLAYD